MKRWMCVCSKLFLEISYSWYNVMQKTLHESVPNSVSTNNAKSKDSFLHLQLTASWGKLIESWTQE